MTDTYVSDWKDALEQTVRRCKGQVIGWKKIEFAQHGLLVRTALLAFIDDPRATFYIEELPPSGNIPRPDLILLHPEIGVLVIENKGIRLGDIQGVRNTTMTLLREGRLKEEDPYYQAEKVQYRLRDLAATRVDLTEVLFLHAAALPRIDRDEFTQKFHEWPRETLFADECADPQRFRQHVQGFSDATMQHAKRFSRLSKHAYDAIMIILNGKGIFYTPRKNNSEVAPTELLGSQIQEMELILKEATPQQKELGNADLCGSHRLFRGVAGSGKSVMLALSVSHALLKFKQEPVGLFGGPAHSRRVLVVCYNKTLVHYLAQKIDDCYGRLSWEKASNASLTITNVDRLIWRLGEQVPALKCPIPFKEKERRANAIALAFDLLDPKTRESLLYDAIYVDEAQDLHPAELMLLRRLARQEPDGKQSLVIFYDNAQNIYGVNPPTWEKLGINIVGRTVFLDQCLRNTRETLAFAFNVLVGSFAAEGQRVTTRQFADVSSLRQRKLVTDNGDRLDINFAPRRGPSPLVMAYPYRHAEIDGVAEAVSHLVTHQRVLPSDILILYKSHQSYGDLLLRKLEQAIGPKYRLRVVDAAHDANKDVPLVREGCLTVSTIASAKGYDAPVVFLMGVDELDTDNNGRASFYVGVTRAKLHVAVSGVKQSQPSLLDEVLKAASALAPPKFVGGPPPIQKIIKPADPGLVIAAAVRNAAREQPPRRQKPKCRHCQSELLHAQHGKFGYFFRCIDCTGNTPIDVTCPKCGKKGSIRKAGLQFFHECEPCSYSEVVHVNVPLESL